MIIIMISTLSIHHKILIQKVFWEKDCFFAIFIPCEENFKHNYKGTFFLERKLLSVVDEILCIATLRMQRISIGFEKTFYPFKNCCKWVHFVDHSSRTLQRHWGNKFAYEVWQSLAQYQAFLPIYLLINLFIYCPTSHNPPPLCPAVQATGSEGL